MIAMSKHSYTGPGFVNSCEEPANTPHRDFCIQLSKHACTNSNPSSIATQLQVCNSNILTTAAQSMYIGRKVLQKSANLCMPSMLLGYNYCAASQHRIHDARIHVMHVSRHMYACMQMNTHTAFPSDVFNAYMCIAQPCLCREAKLVLKPSARRCSDRRS